MRQPRAMRADTRGEHEPGCTPNTSDPDPGPPHATFSTFHAPADSRGKKISTIERPRSSILAHAIAAPAGRRPAPGVRSRFSTLAVRRKSRSDPVRGKSRSDPAGREGPQGVYSALQRKGPDRLAGTSAQLQSGGRSEAVEG